MSITYSILPTGSNLLGIISIGCILLVILWIILIFYLLKLKKTISWQKELLGQLFEENQAKDNLVETLKDEKGKLVKKLGEARARIDEADLLKSNFLANMSHEIRTPMNGIIGFTQFLKEELPLEKREQYVGIIVNSGEQLVQLLDDIVDISRMDAGSITFNRSRCNLDKMLFDLYTQFNEIKYRQDKEDLILKFYNLADDEVNIIHTDCSRLRQVFSNLIGNALKFTHKGVVEFGFTNNGMNELLFFVKDTGIGIPDDKQNIIFERFRQVDQGATRKYGGTGIGLYISKQVITGLGGKIWFESTPNQGSTFYFTLPYESVETNEDVSIFHPPQRVYSWEQATILVAEDLESNYLLISEILKDTNAKVIWAMNTTDVVNICLNSEAPDIVLMDMQMQYMAGYDAVKSIRIHKAKSDLPIIAQTAYAMPNDNLQCLEVGCNDYIAKPINPEALLNKIDRLLSKS